MWQIIVPVFIVITALLARWLFKWLRSYQSEELEDPSCDCWHKEYQDIWNKSAWKTKCQMPIERPRNDPSCTRVFGASRRFSISHLPIPSRVVSWEKPNQIPYAHFKGSAWLLAKYQREYFLCTWLRTAQFFYLSLEVHPIFGIHRVPISSGW